MRANELAATLATNAEDIARMLLPNGKRKGHEWVCGDTDGSEGESLKVRLDGGKAGVWKDFATGDSGDLIGLWIKVHGLSVHQACQEAAQYLGISTQHDEQFKRVWDKPNAEGLIPATDPVRAWIKSMRGLSDEAIDVYRVGTKKGAIVFPYFADGEHQFTKYRTKNKEFWIDANCKPCLFGWQAIPPSARAVTLCEGEFDAMALFDYGIPALSVAMGGGKGDKQSWIEHEYQRLSVYDEIFLCLDMDKVGKEATTEIIHRLGRERCRLVALPHKDANDCLKAGITREQMAECFSKAKTCDPPNLRNASTFEDEVVAEFAKAEAGDIGIRLPWDNVHDRLLLRAGEVSLWFGINGHGKTEVVGNVVSYAVQEVRACVASLEFKPEKWLKRLVRQITATSVPTTAYIRFVIQWLKPRIWVYAKREKTDTKDLIETFRYAARRYHVELFVIDNLAKCGLGEEDYDGQKNFVDMLTAFARDEDIHVMLVHHSKKTEKGEDRPPDKFDAKGTGALSDMVDTVISVWRNKPKERKVQESRGMDIEAGAKPDCLLVCCKQRNGEHEPTIPLWFDVVSHQYHGRQGITSRAIVGLESVIRDQFEASAP